MAAYDRNNYKHGTLFTTGNAKGTQHVSELMSKKLSSIRDNGACCGNCKHHTMVKQMDNSKQYYCSAKGNKPVSKHSICGYHNEPILREKKEVKNGKATS